MPSGVSIQTFLFIHCDTLPVLPLNRYARLTSQCSSRSSIDTTTRRRIAAIRSRGTVNAVNVIARRDEAVVKCPSVASAPASTSNGVYRPLQLSSFANNPSPSGSPGSHPQPVVRNSGAGQYWSGPHKGCRCHSISSLVSQLTLVIGALEYLPLHVEYLRQLVSTPSPDSARA